MKVCTICGVEKSLDEFYMHNPPYRRSYCKQCAKRKNVGAVAQWRRNTKLKLVMAHGNKCLDCGFEGPPFVFDFDHRDLSEKSFGIGANGFSRKYELQYEESLKCDLVCANCHRVRTHKQRCNGCEYCE
jgi:hypothetical protein